MLHIYGKVRTIDYLNNIQLEASKNMAETELTNMVMIQDSVTNKVIVQNRVKKWHGIAFPGGHVKNGESIYDSAIREIKEETGLDIKNLKSCGFMQWYNNQTGDRYFTYFYKTFDFSGEVFDKTDEGEVFWASLDEIDKMKLAPNFKEYLPMFLEDKYSEAFCSWNEDMRNELLQIDNPWGIIYK